MIRSTKRSPKNCVKKKKTKDENVEKRNPRFYPLSPRIMTLRSIRLRDAMDLESSRTIENLGFVEEQTLEI